MHHKFLLFNVFMSLMLLMKINFSKADQISNSFLKRQDDSSSKTSTKDDDNLPIFKWPNFDGPLENDSLILLNATPPILQWGYWYANISFDEKLIDLVNKNASEAVTFLWQSMVEFATNWVESCFQLTNASAKANDRTDTLGRAVVFPFDNPNSKVKIQNISQPFELACFERLKDGYFNTPLFDHTSELIALFHWDENSAIQVANELNSTESSKGGS